MNEIIVERDAPAARLDALGVVHWHQWDHPAARFPWHYDEAETCYFLNGEVVVTPDGGEPVRMGKGDLVTFPAGMSCIWEIREAVNKHYRLG